MEEKEKFGRKVFDLVKETDLDLHDTIGMLLACGVSLGASNCKKGKRYYLMLEMMSNLCTIFNSLGDEEENG